MKADNLEMALVLSPSVRTSESLRLTPLKTTVCAHAQALHQICFLFVYNIQNTLCFSGIYESTFILTRVSKLCILLLFSLSLVSK